MKTGYFEYYDILVIFKQNNAISFEFHFIRNEWFVKSGFYLSKPGDIRYRFFNANSGFIIGFSKWIMKSGFQKIRFLETLQKSQLIFCLCLELRAKKCPNFSRKPHKSSHFSVRLDSSSSHSKLLLCCQANSQWVEWLIARDNDHTCSEDVNDSTILLLLHLRKLAPALKHNGYNQP